MPTAYNPFLLAKLLDRAGHPGTCEAEALVAVRKAYDHCSTRGVTLGDAVQFINGDIFLEAAHMPHPKLLAEIADITMARDQAEAQIAAQAETIANLQRLRAEDAATIHAQQAEIAALTSSLVGQAKTVFQDVRTSLMPDRVTQTARPDAVSTWSGPIQDESVIEDLRAKTSIACECPAEHGEPDEHMVLTRRQRMRFGFLAALGRGRQSIARTLSREFGRPITVAWVGAAMRKRWLSPSFSGLAQGRYA